MYCLFFKQKTAYEMRISDWSSDVCSSDRGGGGGLGGLHGGGLGAGKSEERQEQQIGVAHRAENLRERSGGVELSQPHEACPVRYAPRTIWNSRARGSVLGPWKRALD